jgi:hypothetical protein
MANPVVTPKGTPVGFKLGDGYQTLITMQLKPNIQLWEVTVKPGGFDGGEKVDTTTMHNLKWRTMAPRHLYTLTDMSTTCAYDPDFIPDLLSVLNVQQAITTYFPDNSAIAFFGFLQKAEFQDNKEGAMPLADVVFTPTNWDYVNGVEAGPVFVPAAGT